MSPIILVVLVIVILAVVPVVSIPLLWTVFHVAKLVSSYLGGSWSDRIARPKCVPPRGVSSDSNPRRSLNDCAREGLSPELLSPSGCPGAASGGPGGSKAASTCPSRTRAGRRAAWCFA